MKITRENVAEYAQEKGLEPVQIDGVPEGFSFLGPHIKIGNVTHVSNFIGFIPLADWDDPSATIKSKLVHEFTELYYKEMNKRIWTKTKK